MNCPRCGKPVPGNASFCMHCGGALVSAPVHAAAGPAAIQQSFEQQRKRQVLVLTIVGLIAVIVAILVGLRMAGVLGARAEAKGDTLAAKGEVPGRVLEARGQRTPPVMESGAKVPVMPADVEAWLKHLEECERRKVDIAGDQTAEVAGLMQKMSVLGAGMGLMDPYEQSIENEGDQEPSGYAKGKILDLRPQWQELLGFFRSVPPPDECRELAMDFDRALSEIPGMMGDLGEILNGAASGPEDALKLVKKMQHGSYSGIDRYFNRADEKLGRICAKYEKHKWFNIKADVLAGGMLGKMGSMLGP